MPQSPYHFFLAHAGYSSGVVVAVYASQSDWPVDVRVRYLDDSDADKPPEEWAALATPYNDVL